MSLDSVETQRRDNNSIFKTQKYKASKVESSEIKCKPRLQKPDIKPSTPPSDNRPDDIKPIINEVKDAEKPKELSNAFAQLKQLKIEKEA
jgi:acetyl-CoA carboxylase carboxyltransferase component